MKRAAIIGLVLLANSGNSSAQELPEACRSFADADLIFVGRAGEPTRRRFSSEIEIARAQTAKKSAEQQLEAYWMSKARHSMDPEARRARDYEMMTRLYDTDREVDELIAMDPGPESLSVAPFEIQTWFRGMLPDPLYLLDPAAAGVTSGGTYLVYAKRYITKPATSPESFVLATASVVKDVFEAEEDLAFLNSLTLAPNGATIYGVLRGFGLKSRESYEPLGWIPIEFGFEGVTVRTTSRSNGRFMVSGVPEGRLEIRPWLPQGLTLREPVFKTVERGGCLSSDLVAVPDGRVRGMVQTEQNVPYEFLELMLASEKQAYSAKANDRGEFEFIGVEPGEYVLESHISKPLRPKALCESMPPTYYPGTDNREQAERIKVGLASHVDGLNFVARCDPRPLEP